MKLKEIITRYEMYEEIKEFQVLIIRLRTIVKKLENLVMNKNKIQVNQLILSRILLYKLRLNI